MPKSRSIRRLFACVTLMLLSPIVLEASETPVDGPTLQFLTEQAKQDMNLRTCQVMKLEIDPAATRIGMLQEVQVEVPIEERVETLNLAPHSVRALGYRLIVQVGENDYMDLPPGPEMTFRGTVDGLAGTVVSGSMLEVGMVASIRFPDGRTYWVEPLAPRVQLADSDHYVVYRNQDILGSGNTCATEGRGADLSLPDGPGAAGSGCGSLPCLTEMGCDADFEYYQDYNENVSSVEARISAITNTMNIEYENDVGISHAITAIIVRTVPGLPYTSTSSLGLVTQFRNQWLANHDDIARDIAQLFTGKNIDGSTIGRAFDIGAICTSNSFCFVQSDCCAGFGCVTDLSAHETGHVWNGIHCDCNQFTMNTPLVCANQFTPEFNVPRIVGHRNTRSCLTNLAPNSTLPFFDDFPDPQLDTSLWVSEGASNSTLGNSEPSPSFSLRLNGEDRVYSANLDATGVCLILEYAWQRTGNGGSPEPGEDLIIDFSSESGEWIQVAQHPGAGTDFAPYQFEQFVLPPESQHAEFQLRIRVINAENADDFFVDDVRVSGLSLANITQQPQNQFSCIGGEARFEVQGTGEGEVQYQWFGDGTPIPDATESVLEISDVTEDDLMAYTVEVSNECSMSTSAEAMIVDFGPPDITSQPAGATLDPGETFFAFVGATGVHNFQWFKNGEPIATATEAFIAISPVSCADAGSYFCRMDNGCGTVDTEVVMLEVSGVKTQGDFDDDSDVDLVDFGNLQLCFGVGDTPPAELANCGCVFDFNGDSGIDLDDYGAFFEAVTGP